MPAKKKEESEPKTKVKKETSVPTSSTKAKQLNGNLELVRSIQKLTKTQKDFMESVNILNAYTEETLNDLNIQIESRKLEIEALDEEFKNCYKRKTIELDLFFEQYRYDGAVKILKDRKEEPISSSELIELREKVKESEEERVQELNSALETERASSKVALHSALTNSDLKHKAEIAELNASVKQQKNEIASLQSTIANLKEEVSAQRELTRAVADSSRQGAINQTIGK